MPNIYESFDRAFNRVSAYAILRDGKPVGRVAIKFPADGMGRATAYLQVWGLPMVSGSAKGCGYDRVTAAMYAAGAQLDASLAPEWNGDPEARQTAFDMSIALTHEGDGGTRWQDRLEQAGFILAPVI